MHHSMAVGAGWTNVIYGSGPCASFSSSSFGRFDEFKGRVEHSLGAEHSKQLVFGGRLNIDQARAVAEFLNEKILRNANPVGLKPAGSREAYVARMQLDQ
jgi:hypothetical protein